MSAATSPHTITVVGPGDLAELLVLMRAYCDFYAVEPSDSALLELSRALIADPEREGLQLIARDAAGAAVGFATVFWTWATTSASRIGVMNDLYLAPHARGGGVAERLIEACAEHCVGRGATSMEWLTAPSNRRAQAVYDRVGGVREDWLNYALALAPQDSDGRDDR